MIESADRVPRGTTVPADVCVVGAGAAGIPLALSLSGKGLSVVLLEAGAGPHDAGAQALYAGDLARPGKHLRPDRGRRRGLGGTTQAWDGTCMPLDPIDLERRAHVPHSGWPISWDGLQPWYARASPWLETGRFGTTVPGPLLDGLDDRLVDAQRLEQLSCPTDLGRRYRARLAAASDLRVLTGAHALGVRLHPDGRRVQAVPCATLRGHRFQVEARAVVLAAGGLETARLLLQPDDVVPAGIGNAFDQVGRYYQCQLRGRVAWLVTRGAVRAGHELAVDGVPTRRRMAIAASAQRAEGLLNASFWLQPPDAADPSHGDPWRSLRHLATHLFDPAAAPALPQHLRNVRSGAAWAHAWQAARERLQHARRWPVSREDANRHALWVQAEQQPLPSSRVLLADDRDALGLRKLRVDWRHCLADVASVHRGLLQLASELGRARAGRLEVDEDFGDVLLPVTGTHAGTARMGRDPHTSVVDPDGRVHGVQDLYVAGSAVFPTCGQADPTLTIVALSLRLADHLARRLQPRRAAALELFA
ncbi:FAD-dependent oxidoreductase [Ramlibacter algicola]|uniref:GMC family oxidoreductase n=1 Tax=Ramlibacter algicola TaxID=2795217 RepID=A0A934UQX7_9BURK|nr:GMC family oxidoreductase [Ramlibacter algicola]MBK0392261.1 GMC family oxidoreductase [Ramlibacter algicola]